MSRKPPPLTDRQKDALEQARKQGGKLYRNAVAWGPKEFDPKSTPFDSLHSWPTVRSLVTRNVLRWSGPGEVEVIA
jgi:hypothetical protein